MSDGKKVSGLRRSSSPRIAAFERRGWRYGPKVLGLGLGVVPHRLVDGEPDPAVRAGQVVGWIFSSVSTLSFTKSRESYIVPETLFPFEVVRRTEISPNFWIFGWRFKLPHV